MLQHRALPCAQAPGGSNDLYGVRGPDRERPLVNARKFWGGGIPYTGPNFGEEAN